MLNRQKLAQKLGILSDQLFLDTSHEQHVALKSWQRLIKDPLLIQKLKHIDSPWMIPEWKGNLDHTTMVQRYKEPYAVVAVDGSQVYPDRHEGISCFLINIGVAHIMYGLQLPVLFSSEPTVFAGFDADDIEVEQSQDVVNCIRQDLELDAAVRASFVMQQMAPGRQQLLLCDGSLVFWHLESKGPYLRDRFLASYLRSLQQLYQHSILNAGYISLPKSKELVNIIRLELCQFEPNGCTAHKQVRHIVDTAIARFFLEPGMRSTIFKSTASICKYYPDHLIPHFFYCDVGTEIVRVEIPAWIAEDETLVDTVAAIIIDQAIKGSGYPVVLAEAHEQAVVKGPDREFFYLLLSKKSIDRQRVRAISPKSAKKRSMSV
jgi:hypothetical protein